MDKAINEPEEKKDFIIINKELNEIDPQEQLENKQIIDEYYSKRKESRKESCYSSEIFNNSAVFIEKNSVFEQLFTIIDLINDVNKLFLSLVHENILDKESEVLLKFSSISGILNILMRQYTLIVNVYFSENENIISLKSTFSDLPPTYMIDLESREDICLQMTEIISEYILNNLLFELFLTCQKIYRNTLKIDNKAHFNNIQIIGAKLKTVIELLPDAVKYDKNDIFALKKTHIRWMNLYKIATFNELGGKASVTNSYKKFVKNIHLANAMMAEGDKHQGEIMRSLAISCGAVYYWFLSSEAQKEAQLFYSNPKSKIAIEVWNLPETGLVKKMFKMVFPSIEFHKRIFINSEYNEYQKITMETVQKEINEKTINTRKIDYLVKGYDEKKKLDKKIEEKNEFDVKMKFEKLCWKAEDKIPIRVICGFHLIDPSDPLYFDSNQNKLKFVKQIVNHPMISWLLNPDQNKSIRPNSLDSLIIHIHGGGFISMSSGSHQVYTRKWANSLKVPIFSIDYGLAPKYPYPKAFDDCFQAYLWILNNVETYFKIKPKKIIIAGDSAGGNLAIGITLRCIKLGIRMPDGLLLAYPALNLTWKHFSPSILLALDDQIVPSSFLKMCLKLYLSDERCQSEIDPYISPILISDELLKHFPPVRMMSGSFDPLQDDCWRFAEKLLKLNKDVKLNVYNCMPHGFLNYDSPAQGMAEAKICVQDSIVLLNELLIL